MMNNSDTDHSTAHHYTIEDIYGDIEMADEEFERILNRSLKPRSSEMLYDKMAALGLGVGHHLLDLGCRDAAHTCRLVTRFGCTALGVDPLADHLRRARAKIREAGVGDRLRVEPGAMGAVPADADTFNFIWCRDVLSHVPDLDAGFAECARVLKPGGRMLIYQTYATELLEPGEAARLYGPLAIVPDNMALDFVAAAWQRAGFYILEHDAIASEWREQWEEDGTATTARQLLHIARLRRDRDRLVKELGQATYDIELADCHWGVYQMLGKLCPTMLILGRER